jgi:large subunit ribosomal protein L21
MYAVIRSGGKQYRVAPGDTIQVETLPGKVGDPISFSEVLAVRTDDQKMVSGRDAASASVAGRIVAQGRGPKVRVMKFKKTNQYKIFTGHRQNFTAVEVGEIKL